MSSYHNIFLIRNWPKDWHFKTSSPSTFCHVWTFPLFTVSRCRYIFL